jgi:hypothetical protein
MKFYAYKPREDGTEPVGTIDARLFELKTLHGAINRARSAFGNNFKLFTYTNLYHEETFHLVCEKHE